MAATCQLVNKKTGEKAWRYSVDAKEILAAPGSPWRMTGQVKRSGWATPSGPRTRISASVAATRSVGAEVGKAVVEALAQTGMLNASRAVNEEPSPDKPVEVLDIDPPKGFEDGLPPDPPDGASSAVDLLG